MHTDNPNTRDMKEYREKQIAKEKAIAEYGDYNYIRLTDNKFEQLISIFMELKEKVDDKPLIRINESVLSEFYINESTTRIDLDMSELSEEMLIDAANRCAHYTKWCKMDSSTFLGVYELKSCSVNIKDGTFCFAKYDGSPACLTEVIRLCNENNYSRYGEFEVFSIENTHGIWLCGKMTKLYRYINNESYIEEANVMKHCKYKNCPKCGSDNIGVFIEGEPIYKCKDCDEYLGTVPFSESYVEEETRIEPDKLPKFIYHISAQNHNGEIFEPRKYDNDNVKNGMERYVSRVCFADSIDGCLYSIFPNGAYDADFYVHIPAHEVKVYSTTKDDVYDSEITHELWVKEPVEMKCIGKIHISGVSNKDSKVIDIESDKVPYNKKKYHRCIWTWVAKYYKDESLFESCIYDLNVELI